MAMVAVKREMGMGEVEMAEGLRSGGLLPVYFLPKDHKLAMGIPHHQEQMHQGVHLGRMRIEYILLDFYHLLPLYVVCLVYIYFFFFLHLPNMNES